MNVLLWMMALAGASLSPVAVVERQIAAYNARDADAFAATYALDARIYDPDRGTAPTVEGRAAIRERYAAGFKRLPGARVEILARTSVGDYVADNEYLPQTGTRALVVYEVKDGLISRAWLYRVKS